MGHFIRVIKLLFTYLLLLAFINACDDFPKEEKVNYPNGNLKTRIILLDEKGKRDIENYSEDGELIFIYHWYDSNKNGEYEEYFNNGTLHKKINIRQGVPSKSLSYDKNGILYSEQVNRDLEKAYSYYKDTTLFEVSYLTSVYEGDERVKIIEDSVLTYLNQQLLIKSVNLNGDFFIQRFQDGLPIATDSFAGYSAYRQNKDSLLSMIGLPDLYQFKLE